MSNDDCKKREERIEALANNIVKMLTENKTTLYDVECVLERVKEMTDLQSTYTKIDYQVIHALIERLETPKEGEHLIYVKQGQCRSR